MNGAMVSLAQVEHLGRLKVINTHPLVCTAPSDKLVTFRGVQVHGRGRNVERVLLDNFVPVVSAACLHTSSSRQTSPGYRR